RRKKSLERAWRQHDAGALQSLEEVVASLLQMSDHGWHTDAECLRGRLVGKALLAHELPHLPSPQRHLRDHVVVPALPVLRFGRFRDADDLWKVVAFLDLIGQLDVAAPTPQLVHDAEMHRGEEPRPGAVLR